MDTGPHPTMGDLPWSAEVIVETTEGQHLSEKIDYLMMRGKENPMSETEMWVKFEDCAALVLPQTQIRQLFDMLGDIEHLANLQDLTALCEPQGMPANQAAD